MKKIFIMCLVSVVVVLPFQTNASTQQEEINATLQKLISELMQQVAQLTMRLNEQLAEQQKTIQDLQVANQQQTDNLKSLENINYPKGSFTIKFQQDTIKNIEYAYNPVQVSIAFQSDTKILTPSIDVEVVYPSGNKSNLTLKCSGQNCSDSFQFFPNSGAKQKFEIKYGNLPVYEEFTPTINPYKQTQQLQKSNCINIQEQQRGYVTMPYVECQKPVNGRGILPVSA